MSNEEYLRKLDKDQIHVTTRPYLDKVESHTESYEVSVFSKEMIVLPGVMSPKYDWAGLYMIDYMPKDFSGQDVLELGPGCGLVSVFAGLRGAKSITAADINPVAIENTRLNFAKHKIEEGSALVSDVFSNVPKLKYDSLIFNLPYHNGLPANDLEKGVIDEEYRAMKIFFAEAKDFLKPDGKMYIGFSQSGDLKQFNLTLKENEVRIENFEERNEWNDPKYSGPDFHYNCQVYTCSFEKTS